MTLETRFCQSIHTIAALLLGLLLLNGCAPQTALTKPVRESIRSVSISKDVKMPDEVYYQGPAQSVGAAFGLIGAVIAQSAAEGPKAQIKAAMGESKIDLGQIVRDQFSASIADARVFPSVVPERGDAEVRLEVRIYGLAQPHGLTAQLKPMLGIMGTLARTDGSVLWQKYEFVTPVGLPMPGNTLKEYLENPQLMRDGFIAAAKIVSEGLVKHMQQD